jgi:hypothetical protein
LAASEGDGVTFDRLRVAVACIIVGAWLASITVAFIDRSYAPPATIHLAMVAVVGFLFGPTITGRVKRDDP